MAPGFEPRARAGDGHVLQPQVHAHRLARGGGAIHGHRRRQAQPPVAHRVLREAAVLPAFERAAPPEGPSARTEGIAGRQG